MNASDLLTSLPINCLLYRPKYMAKIKNALFLPRIDHYGTIRQKYSISRKPQGRVEMLQCVVDSCDAQEEKCVAEDRLTEAKTKMEYTISMMQLMG